mmetsp:Transcript_21536/g.54801  ORF Transcript_21536/g.54801 Transcript_21536/m.54801 type:complete len:270 (-) Transcript_21536:618-1427(-)
MSRDHMERPCMKRRHTPSRPPASGWPSACSSMRSRGWLRTNSAFTRDCRSSAGDASSRPPLAMSCRTRSLAYRMVPQNPLTGVGAIGMRTAHPQSMMYQVASSTSTSTMMLSGRTSRCTIRLSCAACRASTSWPTPSATRLSSSALLPSANVVPWGFRRRKGLLSVATPLPTRAGTPGVPARDSSTSFSMSASSWNAGLTTLATTWPTWPAAEHLYTLEVAPAPRKDSSCTCSPSCVSSGGYAAPYLLGSDSNTAHSAGITSSISSDSS